MADQLSIRVEQKDGGRVVHAGGELSLAVAAEMRDVLLAAAESGEPVALNLAGITAIDLCGLQLLCSAQRTFETRGGSFVLQEISDAVRSTASDAGYISLGK
jgi:anti-anti-sigma factor